MNVKEFHPPTTVRSTLACGVAGMAGSQCHKHTKEERPGWPNDQPLRPLRVSRKRREMSWEFFFGQEIA